MADKDLWVTFEKTGSIVDYLSYKGICMDAEQKHIGERTVESVNQGDGNDTVRSSYR